MALKGGKREPIWLEVVTCHPLLNFDFVGWDPLEEGQYGLSVLMLMLLTYIDDYWFSYETSSPSHLDRTFDTTLLQPGNPHISFCI